MLIAQDKDRVNLVYETNHTFRIVSLRHPLPKWDDDLDPHWLGYSAGHWDGKTLVIDTIGQHDQTWLDYSGLPHSEKLSVQERYTLEGPDRNQRRVDPHGSGDLLAALEHPLYPGASARL